MRIIAYIFVHNFIEFKAHRYREQTAELARQCYNLTPRVETLAGNEAFIDLSGNRPPAVRILRGLAEGLVPGLGSFATISLAPCRLLAKAAALTCFSAACRTGPPALPGLLTRDYDKFRLCLVKPETAGMFAFRLPVEMMWPLADTVIKRLQVLGLKSFGEVSRIPLTMLYQQFGSLAPVIMDYSHGLDDIKIPFFRPPDRIVYHASCEGANKLQLAELLREAAVSISQGLREQGKSYRELAVSVFFEDCPPEIKTASFTRGKHDLKSVYYDCLNLLHKARIGGTATEIAVAAGRLVPARHNQMALFEDPTTLHGQTAGHKEKLAALCQNLAAKYSSGVITTGSALPVSRREQMLMFFDPLRNKI